MLQINSWFLSVIQTSTEAYETEDYPSVSLPAHEHLKAEAEQLKDAHIKRARI